VDGVLGAFIATTDGLLVAGDVPDSNENVLAAFAPTVFAQLTKYADMARLGSPESTEIHLSGKINIHIRKVGKLFLGILMPHGRPLPFDEFGRMAGKLQ
jgi:predicted regulator of Ras-like GTPase activity (Roadblock/LC7/MglB family)